MSTFKIPGRPPFAALPWNELTARTAGTIRTGWIPNPAIARGDIASGFNAAKADNRAVFAGKQFSLLRDEIDYKIADDYKSIGRDRLPDSVHC